MVDNKHPLIQSSWDPEKDHTVIDRTTLETYRVTDVIYTVDAGKQKPFEIVCKKQDKDEYFTFRKYELDWIPLDQALYKLINKIIPEKHLSFLSNGGCMLRFEHNIFNMNASDPYHILDRIIEFSGLNTDINKLYQNYIKGLAEK